MEHVGDTGKADPGLRLVGFILGPIAVEDDIHQSTIECDVFLLQTHVNRSSR